MASSDDLGFPFDTNSFLFLDYSPEAFSALTENTSMLVSENEHNEIVGFVPVSAAATNDVHPASLVENSHTGQETLTRTSNFGQEIVTQNQSFHHEDGSNYFNAAENFPHMPSYTFGNDQRESVYSENCLLASSNKLMTTGLQSISSQHGFVKQSYQQPSSSQTIPNFSREPYASTMMGSNLQEVERANGLPNLNPIYGLQDHRIHPSLFQEEQYDNDLLFEQLKHIHENDQRQQPESSNMAIPPYAGALLSNQHQIPFASTPNTMSNPEYRTPIISNSDHILKTSETYSPFTHSSYQSEPVLANDFQNSCSLKTTRRPRGRPRKNQWPMPLVPTTQAHLTSPRYSGTQENGKQPVTAMASLNPTLYNQYQNSYTNTMIQQSGGLRQRSCYDQLENERSLSKRRRIMLPFQEQSIADSSTVSFWQDGNMRSSGANHHEERSARNTIYDPLYAGVGLPLDPHLRFF